MMYSMLISLSRNTCAKVHAVFLTNEKQGINKRIHSPKVARVFYGVNNYISVDLLIS